MDFLYQNILKQILFQLNPEFVHNQFTNFGEILGSNPVGRKTMDILYGYHGEDISKVVDGIKYRTPVLLSAGFDYEARLTQILPFLGFGGAEVGSITARECKGNKSPRLIRLKKNKSIIVNKGLKNPGVEAVIKRLKSRKKYLDFVTGISIALTNDGKCSSIDEAVEDYKYTLQRLVEENIGDYYTLNISCPNAHWGENFGTEDKLRILLEGLQDIKTHKPVYIKMPINQEWDEIEKMIGTTIEFGLNGIIIGNLNKDHSKIEFPEELPKVYKGNLSGKPTQKLSNELIKRARNTFGSDLTIIGVGGVFSPQDAIEKMENGADLVQMITGMIFEGPQLISQISKEYFNYINQK